MGGVDEPAAEGRIQQARAQTKNTMHLASLILSNRSHILLMKAIYIAGRPSKMAHQEHNTMTKTQVGCVTWFASQAAPGWLPVAQKTMGVLASGGDLLEMGFLPWASALDEEDPRFIDEPKAAASVFSLVLNIVASEVDEGRMFSECFPLKFGALVSDDENHRHEALEFARGMWDTLIAAELAARTSESLRQFLVDMAWPPQVWRREISTTLSENRFQNMPGACREELLAFGRGFKSTEQIEDSFKYLRAQEKVHTATKLGRCSRWHMAAYSNILTEADRPQLQVSDKDQVGDVS